MKHDQQLLRLPVYVEVGVLRIDLCHDTNTNPSKLNQVNWTCYLSKKTFLPP